MVALGIKDANTGEVLIEYLPLTRELEGQFSTAGLSLYCVVHSAILEAFVKGCKHEREGGKEVLDFRPIATTVAHELAALINAPQPKSKRVIRNDDGRISHVEEC